MKALATVVNTLEYTSELDHNTLLLLLIFQPICRLPKMNGKLGPLRKDLTIVPKGLVAQKPENELREVK